MNKLKPVPEIVEKIAKTGKDEHQKHRAEMKRIHAENERLKKQLYFTQNISLAQQERYGEACEYEKKLEAENARLLRVAEAAYKFSLDEHGEGWDDVVKALEEWRRGNG